MSTRTSEQHHSTARHMMGIEDVIEVAPYEPWNQPRTAAVAQMMGIEDIEDVEDAREVVSYALRNEPRDIEDVVYVDNAEFTDTQILNTHRLLVERLFTTEALLKQLKDDTVLSVKELQHEINIADRGVRHREKLLKRYNQGWRSRIQKFLRCSKPDVLRQEISNYKSVIASMERILQLVKDNETARLPVVTDEFEENMRRVEDYEAYMRVRGMMPSGLTNAQLS